MSILSCNDEVSRECTNCPEYEPNRIIHVAFVKKGTTFTTAWGVATAAQRLTNLLTAELECNAIIFRNVNGTKPDPTKSDLPGRGKQPSQTGRTTHTVAIQDFDYISNQKNGFYNALEQNAGLYDFYYMTENYAFQVTDTFLKIAAFDPITDDNSTNIIGRVDVMWQQKGNPIAYEIDTDDLDGCAAFTNIIATSSDENILTVTIDEATSAIDIQYLSSELDFSTILVEFTQGSALNIVEVDTPPPGVTYFATSIAVQRTPEGTYTFDLILSNDCGSVQQTFTVTMTVTS